ncbi:hypothetical protein VP249E411_P0222 [Vibrio phage 249E41-1]|nr:hypothetical protein VP249E411_P0222 [Vibrio phage 249E41-1]CAH9014665.1 hypothetical protein VP496E541_P0227 [Vibrio phage 496E54-1]CAH9017456.1 hypothetical protein VP193E371_P0225 [Vibrio phage 193E37-1]
MENIKNSDIITLRLDEIMEEIVTSQNGVFLEIERGVLNEWVMEVLSKEIGCE